MSEARTSSVTRYSLFTRIMGSVFVLVLIMYLVTLGVLGMPLKNRAQQHLDVRAKSELSATTAAIQDHVLLRDYPAIEQAFDARTAQLRILGVRFITPQLTLESRTTPRPPAYPGWFAKLIDIQGPHAGADLVVGGASYGKLNLELDAGPTIAGLWVLLVRFTLLAVCSLIGIMIFLRWMLKANLQGLYALRTAARSIASGDLSARTQLAHIAPPEVRELELAFNSMADHVGRLVAELENEHADLQVEKERLRVTIESIGDAVIVTDATGVIEFINPKAEDLTGFGNDKAQGRHISDVLPLIDEKTGAMVSCPLELALQNNAAVGLDSHTLMLWESGTRIAISDTAAPIRSSDGRVQGGRRADISG